MNEPAPLERYWGYKDYRDVGSALHKINLMKEHVGHPVLFAGITGSHMWGLATEDADVDIRGVYVAPTRQLLSMHAGRDTLQRGGIIDTQFYEVRKALGMMQSHNGNIIELALSPSVFYVSTFGEEFIKIAKGFLSKQLRHYYRGYATSQRKRAAQNRGGKAFVYTYREIYAGIWLMREGYIEYNFRTLWKNIEEAGVYHSSLLPRIFERNKWQVVDDEEMHHFDREWIELQQVLDAHAERSTLPEIHSNDFDMDELLLSIRFQGPFPPLTRGNEAYVVAEGQAKKDTVNPNSPDYIGPYDN